MTVQTSERPAAVQVNPLATFSSAEPGVLVELSSSGPILHFESGNVLDALASLEPQPVAVDALIARWESDPAFQDEPYQVLDTLLGHGVLIPAEQAEAGCRRSTYHLATRDHPFLDMAVPEARRHDNELMDSYARADSYPGVYLELPYESEVPIEDAADLEMPQLWSDPRQCLSLLLSGTFGARRHLAPYVDPVSGYRQLELLFKSVPSGGSRHPTECLVCVTSSAWLPGGLYHFSTRTSGLRQLVNPAEPVSALLTERLGPADDEATECIYVIYASAVDRAMFRYRDPRSFRALLVDIGHADAQLAALAAYCNWHYASGITVDLTNLPQLLGLDASATPVLHAGRLQAWSA